MTGEWTTPEGIAAKVRRRWDDGSLLRAHGQSAEFHSIDIPLRGPRASEIGDDVEAVRAWVARLVSGSRDGLRYDLEWTSVGGRSIGRNLLPSRARVATYSQAWALLGVAAQVRRFEAVLEAAAGHEAVRAWVLAHPLRALDAHERMPRLVAAYGWLDANRGSSRYLREITAPGVDTKFAELNRSDLAGMLGVPSSAAGFAAGLGLRSTPDLLRLRVDAGLGLPEPLSELGVRADEVAALPIAPSAALVVENMVTYLSVPVPAGGVVIWGRGFDVDRVGRLPWLTGVPVDYWGDIDTHGFAILDRLRAWLPQVRSVLMDRDTLVEHRERWVREERPTAAALTRLTPAEHGLYVDLAEGRLGDGVRLEQERIDWSWVLARLGGV